MIYITALTKDAQDDRDYMYECNMLDILPSKVDLRDYTGTIEDQLNVGSCTANAMCSAGEMFLQSVNQFIDLSRLFNYWNSRQSLGGQFVEQDLGSTAREALRAANKLGLPPESVWPYSPSSWNVKPSDEAYKQAEQRKVGGYFRIKNEWRPGDPSVSEPMHYGVKHAIASGYPVMVGIMIGHAMRTLGDKIYYPTGPNNELWGGHEMLIVGYDDSDQTYLIENSWGTSWGVNGYFKCHYSVLDVNAIDLWVVKGFAGIEKCGPNLVVPYVEPPKPEPVPEPVAPPIPDPITPVPPEPEKEDKTVIYVVVALAIAAVVTKLSGVW